MLGRVRQVAEKVGQNAAERRKERLPRERRPDRLFLGNRRKGDGS